MLLNLVSRISSGNHLMGLPFCLLAIDSANEEQKAHKPDMAFVMPVSRLLATPKAGWPHSFWFGVWYCFNALLFHSHLFWSVKQPAWSLSSKTSCELSVLLLSLEVFILFSELLWSRKELDLSHCQRCHGTGKHVDFGEGLIPVWSWEFLYFLRVSLSFLTCKMKLSMPA